MTAWIRYAGCMLAGSLALLYPTFAQEIIAFGDSITKGAEPFDEENLGGYPTRLQALLREEGQTDALVHNYGRGGERVSQGLTRLDSVLDKEPTADTVILMEGSNDIDRIISGEYSLESVVSDFNSMGRKVMDQGLNLIQASIIPRPPWASSDSDNRVTFQYVVGVRDIGVSARPMAEPYAIFTDLGRSVFNSYYYPNKTDPVGHPNAAGFELLAEIFRDKILGIDTLAPVNSGFTKSGSSSNLNAGNRLSAKLHESGNSIRKGATHFTINGREVPTNVSGSGRRVTLSYTVKKSDLECAGRIAVRSEDDASPPNISNRVMAEYSVSGAKVLKGDVDGDCRVNGFDLSLLGLSFGSRRSEPRYSSLADTNNDGSVDGDDLARLASNFGRTSS
ncbi:MAG: GDSL-type esterase/lipase family protein [Thermoanaerobaculia bacterium]